MKTIDKFVLKAYFGPMILTFFIVMFVLMMNFMWRYIDELVGKGLEGGVITELMIYAAVTLIPMGLPLATLLAAIMTMGNMGENYELLAMKSSGMSLPRIMRPLIIVIGMISIGSFFIANNLTPFAYKKMSSLLYDIRQQKQTIEFRDGLFFNGIDNMSIRVDRQDPETHLLTNVLIYDNRNVGGNMNTTIADSGYIRMSDDKRYLLVTLYNGESFDHTRNYQWYEKSDLRRNFFDEQNAVISLSGFDFERSDANMFTSRSQAKNITELEQGIDSLNILVERSNSESFQPLMKALFSQDETLTVDSLRNSNARHKPVNARDSISLMDEREKLKIWTNAATNARNSRSSFSMEEEISKESLSQLYLFKAEWHRKWSLPVSIMIFFLIGAPLGAIIRKGGLGMPIVVSVLFFVIYYIISITGEKLAREGSWSSFSGMWLSTFILLPISVFLVYKATNDSNLFNAEWYLVRYKKVKNSIMKIFKSN